MKLLSTLLLLLVSVSCLFSQEYIKNAKLIFKDLSVVNGDYYFFPSTPNTVQVVDSTGKKSVYPISDIDFVKGQTIIVKNLEYKGQPRLFESLVEGEKMSLYKTDIKDRQEYFVLKGQQLSWLEGGKKEFEKDSKTYSREIVIYKGILKVLMNDNAALAKRADNLDYSEKAISDLVVAYNGDQTSYIKSREKVRGTLKPDWKMYARYSNYANMFSFPLPQDYLVRGTFAQIGSEWKYSLSEGSRHSFKVGIEYGKFFNRNKTDMEYDFGSGNRSIPNDSISFQYLNFNVKYFCDIYRSPKCDLYLGVKLFQYGKIWGDSGNDFFLVTRFCPDFGVEYHLNKKLDVTLETSPLIIIEEFPYSFSLGISYDIK